MFYVFMRLSLQVMI